MTISASRRTDVPCFYSERLFRRVREGYCCMRKYDVTKHPRWRG